MLPFAGVLAAEEVVRPTAADDVDADVGGATTDDADSSEPDEYPHQEVQDDEAERIETARHDEFQQDSLIEPAALEPMAEPASSSGMQRHVDHEPSPPPPPAPHPARRPPRAKRIVAGRDSVEGHASIFSPNTVFIGSLIFVERTDQAGLTVHHVSTMSQSNLWISFVFPFSDCAGVVNFILCEVSFARHALEKLHEAI